MRTLVHVPAGRWLGASAYGEFAVLMAAMLVLAVPALALQAVVATRHGGARQAGRRADPAHRVETVVVAALMVPAVPLFAWLADTGFATTVAGLAAAPILVLIAGVQGLLHKVGATFPHWHTVLAGVGILRSVPVVIALAFGGGAGRLWPRDGRAASSQRAPRGSWCVRASPDAHVSGRVRHGDRCTQRDPRPAGAVRAGGGGVAGLLVSRGLGADDAGVYALGAVATKARVLVAAGHRRRLHPGPGRPHHVAQVALGRAVGGGAGGCGTFPRRGGNRGPLVPLVFSRRISPAGADPVDLRVHRLDAGGAAGHAAAGHRARSNRVALVAWAALAVEGVLVVTIADTVLGLALVAASTATAATGGHGAVGVALTSVPIPLPLRRYPVSPSRPGAAPHPTIRAVASRRLRPPRARRRHPPDRHQTPPR